MLSASMAPSAPRSTLEEMLESIKRQDEQPKDVPPALPSRPTSKARLPSFVHIRRPASSGNSLSEQPPASAKKYAENGGGATATPGSVTVNVTYPRKPIRAPGPVTVNVTVPPKEIAGLVSNDNRVSKESRIESNGHKHSFNELWQFSFLDSPYQNIVEKCLCASHGQRIHAPNENCSVWCKLLDEKWALGLLESIEGTNSIVSFPDTESTKVPICNLLPANPNFLEGVDDLAQLSYLNDPSVLHHIHQRFKKDLIYTKAGSVLIAVNPFKDLSSSGNPIINSYKSKTERSPHVYSVANAAYGAMLTEGKNQSIIISGETGAGKTETAKLAMDYLISHGEKEAGERVLKTNIILESFGNAKTLKNVNSSRFGKLVDIHFAESGKLCGAEIQACLLDKGRVAQRYSGERSYHIFYQLCAGAPALLREKLNLETADKFRYLSHSNCLVVDNMDDKNSFHKLLEALHALRISEDEQEKMFQLVSAILWLGNILFTDNGSHKSPNNNEATRIAANLLGCSADKLIKMLTTRTVQSASGTFSQKLTPSQASEKRDFLARVLYTSLFDWLVGLINKSLSSLNPLAYKTITILDIFGFESFVKNGFEQLLINYANERLRKHSQRHLFELEQEDYLLEGINWIDMKFDDNCERLEILEKKATGLMSLLDEESAVPERTDGTLSIKFKQQLKPFSCFRGEQGKAFSLRHSFGEVTYETAGFLEKNREFMHHDLLELLSSSTFELTKLFAFNLMKEAKGFPSNMSENKEEIRKPSFVTKFKGHLFKMLCHIEKTSPHFIWCIRPNESQLPGVFESDDVLRQLHGLGVTDVIQKNRVGYSTRMTFDHFLKRYGLLSSTSIPNYDKIHACIAILQKFSISPAMHHIGFSKLFLRCGQLERLEAIRVKTLSGIVLIQNIFRAYSARTHFKMLTSATILLQSCARSYKVRKEYQILKEKNRAALIIQKDYRCRRAREKYNRTLISVIQVQAVIRGWVVRRQGRINHLLSHERSSDHLSPTASVGKSDISSENDRVTDRTECRPEVVDPASLMHPTDGFKNSVATDLRLKEKEEENAVLRQRLQQYESRWMEYETKMKSMEEVWQKQIATLQASLASSKKKPVAIESTGQNTTFDDALNARSGIPRPSTFRQNLLSETSDFDWEDATSVGVRTPENSCTPRRPARHSDTGLYRDHDTGKSAVINLVKEFENRTQVFADDANFLVEVKSGQIEARLNPEEELRNLKIRFVAWKKAFKNRLRETKSLLQKLKNKDGAHKTKKKWWTIMSH